MKRSDMKKREMLCKGVHRGIERRSKCTSNLQAQDLREMQSKVPVLGTSSVVCALLLDVRIVQLGWAHKAGMKMNVSDSTFKDKKEFHELLRAKHGIKNKA
jgi:hypothetical protein